MWIIHQQMMEQLLNKSLWVYVLSVFYFQDST